MLVKHAAEGLSSTGLRVLDLGLVPTPVLYHQLHHCGLGGGIMVTGSHNPKEDNGLKLCLGTEALYGEQVSSLRDQSLAEDWVVGAGSVVQKNAIPEYFADVLPRFAFRRKLKVAVDTGNGVMGPVVQAAFDALQIEMCPLYLEPDGDFPNHLPDPEVPKYMKALGALVVEKGCHLGLGFDGDGDRVGVLDETGRKISADWLVALFARDVLRSHPGSKIRFDVKCSDFLAKDVTTHGGIPVMGETGHSLLKRDVKALDAALGGELSGHIVFNRGFVPIDDSLFCALRFLELLDRTTGSVSDLFTGIPRLVTTAEIKVPCPDQAKFRVVSALVEDLSAQFDVLAIDGARVSRDNGWFLVRASHTTPCLTVRFEARTLEALHESRDILMRALQPYPEVDASGLMSVEVLS
jgi:phosphomannomutase/phosphoglucomutase